MDKKIDVIPEDVMAALRSYDWPGNIRELQNVIERSVILSTAPILHLASGELGVPVRSEELRVTRTLAEGERDHIMDVLRQSRGVIGGRNGAAARLGVKRTTLQYRMHKLGIEQRGVRGTAS